MTMRTIHVALVICIALCQEIGAQIITQTIAEIAQKQGPQYAFAADDASTPARNSLMHFMDLVRQRNAGNDVPQCPCVVAAGSDKCIAYDARFQAANIEEAIITFVDTSMDLRIFDERIGGPITPNTFRCSSDECQQCVGMLVLRLRQVGMLSGNVEFPFAVPAESSLRPDGCPRLRMSHAVPKHFPPPAPTFLEPLIDEGRRFISAFEGVGLSPLRQQIEQALIMNHVTGSRPLITQIINEAHNSGAAAAGAVAARAAAAAAGAATAAAGAAATAAREASRSGQQRQQQALPNRRPQIRQQNQSQQERRQQQQQVRQGQPQQQQQVQQRQQQQQQSRSQNSDREHVNLPFSMPPPRLIPVDSSGSGEQQRTNTLNVNSALQNTRKQFQQQQRIQQQTSRQQRPNLQQQPSQSLQQPLPQQRIQQEQINHEIGLSPRPTAARPAIEQFQTAIQNPAVNELNNNLQQIQQQPGEVPRPEPHFEPSNQASQTWSGISDGHFTATQQQQQWQQQQPQQQPQFGQTQPQSQQQFWTGKLPQIDPQSVARNWPQAGLNPRGIVNAAIAPESALWHSPTSGGTAGAVGNGPGGWVGGFGNAGGGWSGNPVGGWGGNPAGGWGGNPGGGWGGNAGGGWGAHAGGGWGGVGGGNIHPGGRGGGFGGIGIGRKKRQVEENIIGKRFVINCVERGEVENEDTDFLNLCTACWTWRQLPEEYFPRLLNELVCNENDYCLSGWGECHQRFRNVDVLRRVGGDWRPTTISTASCCDCKVKAGSQIHALVTGKSK